MKLIVMRLLGCLFACLLFPKFVMANVSVTDDVGHVISLDHPAQRIVSLAPHVTELLFAAGAGDKIVGVVEYSDYPEAAKDITSIGSAMQLDLETLLALKPDLVVGWHSGNPKPVMEKVEALGLPLFRSEPRQLEAVATNIERLGVLAGTQAIARQMADEYRQQLHKLQQQNKDKSPVRAFYQVWHQPLMTVSGQHLISKIIELCGGENIFANLSALAPQVSTEAVIVASPQVIISSDSGESREKLVQQWLKWDSLAAVKLDGIYVIHPDVISRHTPRIVQGAEQMCHALDEVRAKLKGDARVEFSKHK